MSQKKAKPLPPQADQLVEEALFQRALGYRYTEETRERVKDPATGQYSMVVTKRVRKQMAPNTSALFFWLKNRLPQQWGSLIQTIQPAQQDGLLAALDGFAKNGFEGGDDAGDWEVE